MLWTFTNFVDGVGLDFERTRTFWNNFARIGNFTEGTADGEIGRKRAKVSERKEGHPSTRPYSDTK